MLRANFPAILIRTTDEERALACINGAANAVQREMFTWSITRGLMAESGSAVAATAANQSPKNLDAVFSWAALKAKPRTVVVLLDAHPYIWGDPVMMRTLRETAFVIKSRDINLVLIGAAGDIPRDLEQEVTAFDLGLPDADELTTLIASVSENAAVTVRGEVREIARAAQGLSRVQAENALSLSIITDGGFTVEGISAEKRAMVAESGVLEFIEVDPARCGVGGLDLLRAWLKQRAECFSDAAREYGLPAPKGVLFVGPPGCGKSASAKAVAAEWRLPLLRLDISRMHGSLLGQSEALLRKAIETAEAVAPCILWFDELEKSMGGAPAGGRHEASERQMSYLLTWMQERTSEVFVWATANDVTKLRPEMLRKGRFDEIFACDLPSPLERGQILELHLKRRGHDWDLSDMVTAADAMDGFSGAEIEAAVVDGMFAAFGSREKLSLAHVLAAAAATVPLSVTMQEDLKALRDWYKARARAASGAMLAPDPSAGSLSADASLAARIGSNTRHKSARS